MQLIKIKWDRKQPQASHSEPVKPSQEVEAKEVHTITPEELKSVFLELRSTLIQIVKRVDALEKRENHIEQQFQGFNENQVELMKALNDIAIIEQRLVQ